MRRPRRPLAAVRRHCSSGDARGWRRSVRDHRAAPGVLPAQLVAELRQVRILAVAELQADVGAKVDPALHRGSPSRATLPWPTAAAGTSRSGHWPPTLLGRRRRSARRRGRCRSRKRAGSPPRMRLTPVPSASSTLADSAVVPRPTSPFSAPSIERPQRVSAGRSDPVAAISFQGPRATFTRRRTVVDNCLAAVHRQSTHKTPGSTSAASNLLLVGWLPRACSDSGSNGSLRRSKRSVRCPRRTAQQPRLRPGGRLRPRRTRA